MISRFHEHKAPKNSRNRAPRPGAALLEKPTCMRLGLENSLHAVNTRKLGQDGSRQTVNPSPGLLPAHHPSQTTPFIAIKPFAQLSAAAGDWRCRIPEKPATKTRRQQEAFGNLHFWGSFHPVNATGVRSGPRILLPSVLT